MFFTDLLTKYLEEVSPDAKILFMSFIEQNGTLLICFLSEPGNSAHTALLVCIDPGMMVSELKSKLKLDCLQLKLSKKRPDLTKLDSFLGVLSAEGSFFETGMCEIFVRPCSSSHSLLHFLAEITAFSRVFDFCGLHKCLECITEKKSNGRYFMVSLWTNVLVDMVKRELEKQEPREEEMLEALRNIKVLAEKSSVAELVAEVEGYMSQLATEDFNEKRYSFFSPFFYWLLFLC